MATVSEDRDHGGKEADVVLERYPEVRERAQTLPPGSDSVMWFTCKSSVECKVYRLRGKRTPGNLMLEPWSVLKALRRNGIKGSGAVRTRPHPANPAV